VATAGAPLAGSALLILLRDLLILRFRIIVQLTRCNGSLGSRWVGDDGVEESLPILDQSGAIIAKAAWHSELKRIGDEIESLRESAMGRKTVLLCRRVTFDLSSSMRPVEASRAAKMSGRFLGWHIWS